MSSIYDWSIEAARNANSDPAINWAEGQPPSSVNNSARAMMQRHAEWLRDISGQLEVTGTPDAIQVMLASSVAEITTGIIFRAVVPFNANAGAKLILNGLAARPIEEFSSAGVVSMQGSSIRANGVYEFLVTDKSFLLLNPTNPPLLSPFITGEIKQVLHNVVPEGWLYCNGRAISRTDYADLFGVLSTQYGEGDGKTTFNLPDFRGLFLRGWDDGRGIDDERTFGQQQDSENKEHAHEGTAAEAKTWGITHINTHGWETYSLGVKEIPKTEGWTAWATTGRSIDGNNAAIAFRGGWMKPHDHTLTLDESGGSESRPVNQTVIYIVKT